MNFSQFKDAGWLFSGQLVIKLANFLKQILLAFFLGISADIDLFLAVQIVPAILSSMVGGGAGEVLVTGMKKKNEFNPATVIIFIAIISFITIILSGLYLLTVPVWLEVFNISAERVTLFWTLSFIVAANNFPLSLVSSLKHLLFFRKKYRYYIFTSLISEVAGILTILILVNKIGIIAFAYGLLISSTVNAILFFNIHGLSIRLLFIKAYWIQEKQEVTLLLKRAFTLSIQTLVNHLSTFWERTLSMRFLTSGYLSALNYSKSLNEMPKTIMLSSILTTTYIEQVNHKTESEEVFKNYTWKMEGILSQLSFIFQLLSIIFAPLILILIFRRGKFDNDAVSYTLIIYQILTIGFIPGLMMNFFSRTMYILGRFKQLFYFILVKFLFEASLMLLLINLIPHAIPFSLVAGKLLLSFCLFYYISGLEPGIFHKKNFLFINIVAITITIGILFLNQALLNWLLGKSAGEILIIYSPILIICSFFIVFYLSKKDILKPLLSRISFLNIFGSNAKNQN